jgi:hypothetical protein
MRLLSLLLVMLLSSCGPLYSKTIEKDIPGKSDSANSEDIVVLQAGKTTPPKKHNDQDNNNDNDNDNEQPNPKYKKKHKPHQGPGQHKSPGQSPHQGKSAPTLDITSIEYSGLGCAGESLESNISDDGLAFTLLFSDFVSIFFPEDAEDHEVQECNVDISFDIPTGWRFSILTLDHRGFAELSEGDSATITTELAFENGDQTTFESVIEGETAEDFEIREEIGIVTNNWIGCDTDHDTLSMNVAVSHENTSDDINEISIDSIDGELSQKYAVVWSECD